MIDASDPHGSVPREHDAASQSAIELTSLGVGWSEQLAGQRVRAELFGTAVRPLLSRYVLDRPIGRGAMGEVWRARDPQLDRDVAIKLLLPSAELSPGALARLAREARSLARLSHPHVVQVFDLGTYESTHGRRGLFIVMELVVGCSLTEWLVMRRTSREALDVFIAAGQGLMAAHDVGLVHRDFKPGNVLVGEDGRVRVGDFGLARLADRSGAKRRAEIEDVGAHEMASTLERDLTGAGGVVGTPLYMSPEQHEGAEVDARSDQYSFCVALFEALHHVPPFRGSVHALFEAKREGYVPIVAGRNVDVSEGLRAAIVRGLEPDPDRRWPSMQALVETLQRLRQPRRGRMWIAAACATTIGGAVWLGAPSGPCEAPDAQRRAWTPSQRAAVADSLASVLPPSRVEPYLATLDAWTAELADASADACVADPTRATARWDCLHTASQQFQAIAETLTVDGLTAEAAAKLQVGLSSPSLCAERVETSEIPPNLRPIADDLATRLARARALLDADRTQAALALATSVRETIDGGGPAYAGLANLGARARFDVGVALWELHATAEAEAEFAATYFAAIGEHDDDLAFSAASRLAMLCASLRRDHDARQWLEHTAAAYAAQRPSTRSPSALALARGIVEAETLGVDAATRHYRDAIDSCSERSCERIVATAKSNIARAYTSIGDDARAYPSWLEAGEYIAMLYGPESSGVLIARINAAHARTTTAPAEAVAELDAVITALEDSAISDPEILAQAFAHRSDVLVVLGRPHEAAHDISRAIEAARRAPTLPSLLSFVLSRAADVAIAIGEPERARSYYAEVLANTAPDDHFPRIGTLTARALLAFSEGDHAGGLVDQYQAHEHALALYGGPHPHVAVIEGNIAEALSALGRWPDALAAYDRAIATRDALAPDAAPAPDPWVLRIERSQCLRALGRRDEAIAALRSVLTLAPADSEARAQAEAAL